MIRHEACPSRGVASTAVPASAGPSVEHRTPRHPTAPHGTDRFSSGDPGIQVHPREFSTVFRAWSTAIAEVERLELGVDDHGGRAEDGKLGDFLTRRVGELLGGRGQGSTPASAPDAGVMGFLERRQCAIEGCDDLNDIQLSAYGVYEELRGGNVRVPGGFSRVTEALANKVRASLSPPLSPSRSRAHRLTLVSPSPGLEHSQHS